MLEMFSSNLKLVKWHVKSIWTINFNVSNVMHVISHFILRPLFMSVITIDLVNFRLNEENLTATVAPSPMASKNIVIPVFVESNGKQYTVVGIEDYAFSRTGIKTMTFGKGSKVTSFGNGCFSESSLIRLT